MRPHLLSAVISVACLATLTPLRTAHGQAEPQGGLVEGDATAALEKLHAQALLAYKAHDPAKAVQLLEPALTDSAVTEIDPGGQNPQLTAILNDYGFFLSEAGFHERAVAVLQVVLARAPDRGVAYLNLADAEYAQGQAEPAREHYLRYAAAMEAAGKADKFPARVAERIDAGGATFTVKDASSAFDVTIRVATCDEKGFCKGAVSYSFHAKGSSRVFQVIEAPDTSIWPSDSGGPLVNQTLLYDVQSAINVGDFNFDGVEDVAVCTGHDGSYGMPSYDVYLGSKKAKTFVHSKALSRLGKHLGMFTADAEQKRLSISDKSGCCWHMTQSYAVVANRPVMVYERIEDATTSEDPKITEKTLVRGKWKTVKR